MNTSACRKNRALQWQRNRFESRKNLTLEQRRSARSMRCFIEHHPRSYQIYTAQMTNMKASSSDCSRSGVRSSMVSSSPLPNTPVTGGIHKQKFLRK